MGNSSVKEPVKKCDRLRAAVGSLRAVRLLIVLFALAATALAAEFAVVRYVIDGDTVVLADGERIRYIGLDAPEIAHEGRRAERLGNKAHEANRKLVQRKKVRLEYDVERMDKYGRTLAYVWVDTTFVNARLIKDGLARVLVIPPNTKYERLFRRLELEAKAAGRGIWARK